MMLFAFDNLMTKPGSHGRACVASDHDAVLQDAIVRDTAVSALLDLYADEDNVEPMHELTARFAPRFAQLIHDVDEGVAVKGVSQSCTTH